MKTSTLALLATLLVMGVSMGTDRIPGSTQGKPAPGFGRVKWKVHGKWMTLEKLRETALSALKEKGLAPPGELRPSFDLFPQQRAFLRVMFGQGIGKRSWSVDFDREGNVIEVRSVIMDG